MGRRIGTVWLCALLGAGACAGPQHRPEQEPMPELASSEEGHDTTIGLECSVACTETMPREPIATVRWTATKDVRLKALAQQRLEATTYKDGFEQGTFVAVQPAAKMEMKSFAPGGTGRRELPPALARLRTVPPPPDDAKLRIESTAQNPVALVVGLEPGLNYFWRIATGTGSEQVTSETVRCQAPVCPFDSDRAPDPSK